MINPVMIPVSVSAAARYSRLNDIVIRPLLLSVLLLSVLLLSAAHQRLFT